MYRIAFTPGAIEDLDVLRVFDAKRIIGEIESQLSQSPASPSRNRKRLRPNRLSEWELRVGEFRVFYDIILDDVIVRIVALGQKIRRPIICSRREV